MLVVIVMVMLAAVLVAGVVVFVVLVTHIVVVDGRRCGGNVAARIWNCNTYRCCCERDIDEDKVVVVGV